MNKENREERYDMQKAGTLLVQANHNAKLIVWNMLIER
jgi:hypothetical protein